MLASLGFTFFYAIATTLIVTLLAIPLAVVLNEAFFGRNFVLAVFFFPAIPSVAVLGVVLAFILSPLKSGAANSMLAVVGIDPVPWLADAWLARLSTVIVSVLGADRLACGPLSRVYPVDPEGLLRSRPD